MHEKTKSALMVLDSYSLYVNFGKKFEGKRINYGRVFEYFAKEYDLVKAYIYGMEFGEIKPSFKAMLKAVGYSTRYKKVDNPDMRRFLNNNIQIFADVLGYLDKIDTVILGSHDMNFIPMVEFLQSHHKEVVVANCWISRELKDVADKFLEFDSSFIFEGTDGSSPVSAFRGSRSSVPSGASSSDEEGDSEDSGDAASR